MIGTGKESDIHIVLAPPSPPSSTRTQHHHRQQLILKIHRLGRISFRSIKTNRDYLRHRTSATWLYMSRLSAQKEYSFMCALHSIDFPVPQPVAWNRHTVVMGLVEGTPLYQIRHLGAEQARGLYAELMAMIVKLAGVGLIHGDFNEFNVMVEERETKSHSDRGDEGRTVAEADVETQKDITLRPILIDFPQMLSVSHPNAATYFERDVNCVKRYFSRRYHFTSDDPGPFFADVEKQMRKNGKGGRRLDVEVEASGFSKKMAKELEKYMEEVGAERHGDGDDAASADGSSDGSDGVSGEDNDEESSANTPFTNSIPSTKEFERDRVSSAGPEAVPFRVDNEAAP